MTSLKSPNSAGIEDWFSTQPAKRLLNLELGFLQQGLADYSGSRALLLGPVMILRDLPIAGMGGMVWQLEPQFAETKEFEESIHFVGDLMFAGLDWPFQDESLDLVVLCHSLPAVAADSVLMEAWRVLAPEGQILVTAMHDPKWPTFIDYDVLRNAIKVIPESLLSNRHYCSKLPFSWRGNVPGVISRFCPLHTMQWIKHKPAMVGRFQFKLPKTVPIVPSPANITRGCVDEKQ